ncbi:SYC2L protein, partial [Galbula dea]|nr:SYC2L protein [Galbula dea]
SNYRKHLFSESNNEHTSPAQSERSWILDSQKRSLPKSLDYTRKRPRVRSKLKVLPVSSPSSGSDYRTKMVRRTSRQRSQKETLRKKSSSITEGEDLPIVDLADEDLSEELKEGPLPLDASTEGYSSVVEKATQVPYTPPDLLGGCWFLSKPNAFYMLNSTVIKKPKFSTWETSHLFSDALYQPRKPFDSAEIQKGKEMEANVDDAFFSKMLQEDFSGSGVITAFENFTDQLKKLFWSRYKRMESSAHNTLRTSEKNLSTLLNQIHEC